MDIANGAVAFVGSPGGVESGVYSDRTGSLDVVADNSTSVPGSSETFSFFGATPSIDSTGSVAFRAVFASGSGIYLDAGIALRTVADTTTAIPDGAGSFSFFLGNPSVDGGLVLFRGAGSGGQDGIYAEFQNQLLEVLASGDALDGRTVLDAAIDADSVSGLDVVLRARFTDGSEGVYITTIPEPSTGLLVAAGLGALAARRRRARGSGLR